MALRLASPRQAADLGDEVEEGGGGHVGGRRGRLGEVADGFLDGE